MLMMRMTPMRRRLEALGQQKRHSDPEHDTRKGLSELISAKEDNNNPRFKRKASFFSQTSFITLSFLLLLIVFVSLVQPNVATDIVIEVDGSSNTVSEEEEEEGVKKESLHDEVEAAEQQQESSETHQSVVSSLDDIEDSLFDPLQADPDCDANATDCWAPPPSTVEETTQRVTIDATCSYGGDDPDKDIDTTICSEKSEEFLVDQHWGSDPAILRMRDKLRKSGSGLSKHHSNNNHRPPIFLMPGLASTRLVAWRFKSCPHHRLLSDIKVQDYVWLNINLIMQMGTIDVSCMKECLQLGVNQTDTDDLETGCKLRPDEGLDAISSLSPGGIGSQLLVGGTNTVYAWLIQWLADNLGYDVSNIVGLPYDWRLSPDKMEQRDGFLTVTRRRIEAAVQTNGKPGIMVAHSMGNIVFRYFLEWLRTELREEAYQRYIKQAERRARAMKRSGATDDSALINLPGWMSGVVSNFDELWAWVTDELDRNKVTAKREELWELAQLEGDTNWYEWVEDHIWTYVGLSAPIMGAVNPLRAVISGENMGLPVADESARVMEATFGSTHTVNPISTKEGFCDQWDFERWDEEPNPSHKERHADSRLACLDDIVAEIEEKTTEYRDPWTNFAALKALLHYRADWDSEFPMIQVVREYCEENEKPPCAKNSTVDLGPKEAQTGKIFTTLSELWREKDEPLVIKREQLRESFWDTKVPNILNRTWERPLIKHVIMAYGIDIPTEVGYKYKKQETQTVKKEDEHDGVPGLQSVLWEDPGGGISEERLEASRGRLTDLLTKKKTKRTPVNDGIFQHSGDGSVPYLSLSWAHTWLLHGMRAKRHSGNRDGFPLDKIQISHRPKGAMEWKNSPPPQSITIVGEKKIEESSDTGTAHPHGTKYKPEMVRYHSAGKSRTTGIDYSTTVIEAIGVEHKETTRNYDILAAVFTDVLRRMHDDLNIV